MIKYCEGNILTAEAEALVNTVNTVGVMGKGIALQFKKAFPEMEKAYVSACKQGRVAVGSMHVWDSGSMLNPRYIINFPTKKHWKNPSQLSYITSGLSDLSKTIRDLGIHSIAIPPLGCGLGGLDWNIVRQSIVEALSSLEDVDIWVYLPNGAPAPEDIINNTKEPKLTYNLANFLRILEDYYSLEYTPPMLIEIHKLSYFYERSGEPLDLNFTERPYGPYSDRLYHWLNNLEGHFILGIGDGKTAPYTPIHLIPEGIKKVNAFLEANKEAAAESRARADKVIDMIRGFENPYGMELLASVLWVIKDSNAKADSLDKVIAAIHQWNDRKKTVMRSEHIEIAWNRLKSVGWI